MQMALRRDTSCLAQQKATTDPVMCREIRTDLLNRFSRLDSQRLIKQSLGMSKRKKLEAHDQRLRASLLRSA